MCLCVLVACPHRLAEAFSRAVSESLEPSSALSFGVRLEVVPSNNFVWLGKRCRSPCCSPALQTSRAPFAKQCMQDSVCDGGSGSIMLKRASHAAHSYT